MRNRKRVTALALAAFMGMSVVGCGKQVETQETSKSSETNVSAGVTEAEDSLKWLNTSGSMPLVEEGTEKTLTIAVKMGDDSPNPEETWAYRFIENQMNINLKVTKFTSANIQEFVSLTFADNELPDIIIGGSLSTGDLVNYGFVEGQIIDLAPYITEENAPNLYKIYQENPEYLDAVRDSEGHIWSLGYINDPADRGQVPRAFLNYDWLEEEELEVPTDLESFLETMRAFKERQGDVIPIGGSYKSNNPCVYFLNAFGYNTTSASGASVALRDGEVVLPIADREAYGSYLTFMNTLYTEGLIHPDFYTMDSATTKAVAAEGRNGFLAQAPFVFSGDFNQWWGALPLTSEYNKEAFWPVSTNAVSCGQFVVTSSCKDVELAVAFADWFYGITEDERVYKGESNHYELISSGPESTQTEYLDGIAGYVKDEKGNQTYPDLVNNPSLYSNKNDYLAKKIQLWGYTLFGKAVPTDHSVDPDISGYMKVSDVRKSDELSSNGELSFRMGLQETVCKYTVAGFPSKVYLDYETTEYLSNLMVVISEYAQQESAKFVTGARPLSELDAYFDEIERLGALEYIQVYADYYANIQ